MASCGREFMFGVGFGEGLECCFGPAGFLFTDGICVSEFQTS